MKPLDIRTSNFSGRMKDEGRLHIRKEVAMGRRGDRKKRKGKGMTECSRGAFDLLGADANQGIISSKGAPKHAEIDPITIFYSER
jgi:hypothetical protein